MKAHVESLYQEKSDAIVSVKVATRSTDENGKESTALTVTSGFFISPEGEILTNAIPPKDVVRIWIIKDKTTFIAEHVATDRLSNISLIKTVNLPSNFTHISPRPPTSPSRIGSFAFLISSPLDFAPSPAWGLITGFESRFGNLAFPFTYMRINIPIGPAEGGAPVFNSKGELLGISVATLPEIASGYLVPTVSIQRILESFNEVGHAVYSSIPLSFSERLDSSENRSHVFVESIIPNGQADKAGIKVGDILLTCNDVEIRGVNQLSDLIFFTTPGAFLPIVIQRNNNEMEFALLIEAMSDQLPRPRDSPATSLG